MNASPKVLNVQVGETLQEAARRAADAMRAAAAGKQPAPYFGIGFQQVSEMLAAFTPRRWELIAVLREAGPTTVADLARRLKRDYKNVHADVRRLIEWMAVERGDDGLVSVPWSEIVVDMKLPQRVAA